MLDAHFLKLRQRDFITADEERAIRRSVSDIRELRPDEVLVRAGDEIDVSTLLIDGWMARSKLLRGGQRQITELHLPGDFPDLHSFTLKRLDHDVFALTQCRVAVIPHENLVRLTERFPHLTRVYWFLTNLDAAIQREWTLSLGRRSAKARMAHMFCELFYRLKIIGQTRENSFAFPLTQADIAECLGLTSVHINRTLQALRRADLVRLADRRLTILDLEGLLKAADFDADYLYLDRRER